MEYNNRYNANTGEQIRTPRRTQGPPTQENSSDPAFEPAPSAAPPFRYASAQSRYGDLLLLAALLLLWLERHDEDALFTLLALLLIG